MKIDEYNFPEIKKTIENFYKIFIKYCPNCGSELEGKENELNNCSFCFYKFKK